MNPILHLLWGDAAEAAALAGACNAAAWQAIDRRAGQHRLRPMLHVRATASAWPVPADLKRQWHDSYQRAALRALRQKAALASIGKAFGRHGIAAAALKGGAFVWSGGLDPALRPMRDLDLLIRPEDAARVVEVLAALGFAGTGQPHDQGAKHLPPLSNGTVTVEPHLHIFDTYDAAAAASEAAFIARAWQRAGPAGVPGLAALSPTDTLLHLILHAVLDHQFNNGPLLLADMTALVETGQVDWAILWEEAERLDAVRACQLALGVGQALAGLSVDWGRHKAPDLGAAEIERVARLMLVDMAYRSAVGWPGRLLRLSPAGWLGQIPKMLRRRQSRQEVAARSSGNPALRDLMAFAVGDEGRGNIADAVSLARWLKRKP